MSGKCILLIKLIVSFLKSATTLWKHFYRMKFSNSMAVPLVSPFSVVTTHTLNNEQTNAVV